MSVRRVNVHCVEIEDKPGSLQKFLAQSSLSGVDLECFVAFSYGRSRGRVYLTAKQPEAFEAFASEAELCSNTAAGFIFTGEDRVGAAAGALEALAENDISGIAGSAIAHDGQYQMLIIVSASDADRAAEVLGA